MADFGGEQEFTTWDGEPVSREAPHGATVVVASRAPQGWRYLLLHRVHHGGPAREGDWQRCQPAELEASFLAGCAAAGFG